MKNAKKVKPRNTLNLAIAGKYLFIFLMFYDLKDDVCELILIRFYDNYDFKTL